MSEPNKMPQHLYVQESGDCLGEIFGGYQPSCTTKLGIPVQGLLFEAYLEKQQFLEGNTRKIINVFR